MIKLRIKEVAAQKGISMGKLSRSSDISLTTIRKIYSDPYYSATTITLDKLAKALGVPARDLIEETPD